MFSSIVWIVDSTLNGVTNLIVKRGTTGVPLFKMVSIILLTSIKDVFLYFIIRIMIWEWREIQF